MDQWKTIEPGVWRPVTEGDQIIGVLVSKEPKNDVSGISAKYYIDTGKGMFFVWGSTVLDDRMQYVKVNQKIRITYEGKTKNKRGQDMNLFRVDIADNSDDNGDDRDSKENNYNDVPISFGKIESVAS